MNFDGALARARELLLKNSRIASRGSVAAEAERLVEAAYRRATGSILSRLDLYSRGRELYPQSAETALQQMLEKRLAGAPLQHVTGVQAFLDHEYEVGPEVLIPRPESEILAEIAIRELASESPRLGLEIGLGSGVLSVELLAAYPALSMVASELSPEAASVARRNANSILGTASDRLRILRVQGALDVLAPFRNCVALGSIDFMISNPPYLLSGEAEPEVAQFEPSSALWAPEGRPLHFYEELASNAGEWLRPGGWVFLEMPHERASQIVRLFEGQGWDIRSASDLNERERVLIARLGRSRR